MVSIGSRIGSSNSRTGSSLAKDSGTTGGTGPANARSGSGGTGGPDDPSDAELREAAFRSGLAGYLGDRLTSGIGGPLTRTQISTRPLLVFGETDPATRLTVSVDLSSHVALATSVNLSADSHIFDGDVATRWLS